jgi:hypothetical protein
MLNASRQCRLVAALVVPIVTLPVTPSSQSLAPAGCVPVLPLVPVALGVRRVLVDVS